jgi:hypothetical protein
MAEPGRSASLSRGQRAAVGAAVALGLGLAGYGVAGSYQTVSGLAERRGVPLASFVPVGIDGGLIGVVVLDLVLSWIGQPIGWLRQLVRILTVGTVAAKAAAGWPDLVSAGLHVAAPLMLLAMVEAGRTVLLRRINSPDGRTRDPIPAARWALAPWPTWLMWRRMVLWRIASFQDALEAEQERRLAITLLKATYGRRWKRHTPPELAWMLRSGVSVHGPVARARAIAAAADTDSRHLLGATDPARWETDMSVSTRTATNGHAARRNRGSVQTREKPRSASAAHGPRIASRGSTTVKAGRADSLARAGKLLADQPDMTGADLGRELGVSPRHGLRLKGRPSGTGQTMCPSRRVEAPAGASREDPCRRSGEGALAVSKGERVPQPLRREPTADGRFRTRCAWDGSRAWLW